VTTQDVLTFVLGSDWRPALPYWLLVGGLLVLWAIASLRETDSVRESVSDAPKPGGWGLRQRWWPSGGVIWRVGPYRVPLNPHAAAVGTTGSGKSATLATLVDGQRPTLILAFDRSDPLQAAVGRVDGLLWTPRSSLGLRILEGQLPLVVQRVVSTWPKSSGDTGVYRSQLMDAAWDVLEAMDAAGEERTLARLVERLQELDRPGRMWEGVRDSWVSRLRYIARVMGPSLGTDLDLAEAMRDGETVMLQFDSFLDTELMPMYATIAILDAMRVAEEVGGFLLLIDEGGALGERAQELDALFRASRARGVHIAIATQSPSDFNDVLRSNVGAWLLLGQGAGAVAERRWASATTVRQGAAASARYDRFGNGVGTPDPPFFRVWNGPPDHTERRAAPRRGASGVAGAGADSATGLDRRAGRARVGGVGADRPGRRALRRQVLALAWPAQLQTATAVLRPGGRQRLRLHGVPTHLRVGAPPGPDRRHERDG
jgi:hypothetical protein